MQKISLFCRQHWDFVQKYLNKAKFPQISKVVHRRVHWKKTKWMHNVFSAAEVLQWPNPHNKESPWFTHCLLEKMGNPANCQSTIFSLSSLCFSFLGLPWPPELRWPVSSTVGREVGEVYWSQLAANRLYHYCSLSDCKRIKRKNNRGDNPQSLSSGLTNCKLLDCLTTKNIFRGVGLVCALTFCSFLFAPSQLCHFSVVSMYLNTSQTVMVQTVCFTDRMSPPLLWVKCFTLKASCHLLSTRHVSTKCSSVHHTWEL